MSKKLAIIHTTSLTINPLKDIVNEIITDCRISNFMDDTILPQLINNGGNIDEVEERWTQYVKYAEQTGADCILSACSTVGGIVDKIKNRISVPLLRIDEPMAERAVMIGDKIGIAATLQTTMTPTLELIKKKAENLNRKVIFKPILVEGAFSLLSQGDEEGHDRLVISALENLAEEMDVVVLAQASMARTLVRLPEKYRGKFLTSPRLGIERVKQALDS